MCDPIRHGALLERFGDLIEHNFAIQVSLLHYIYILHLRFTFFTSHYIKFTLTVVVGESGNLRTYHQTPH